MSHNPSFPALKRSGASTTACSRQRAEQNRRSIVNGVDSYGRKVEPSTLVHSLSTIPLATSTTDAQMPPPGMRLLGEMSTRNAQTAAVQALGLRWLEEQLLEAGRHLELDPDRQEEAKALFRRASIVRAERLELLTRCGLI